MRSCALILTLIAGMLLWHPCSLADSPSPEAPSSSTIVMGFVGGFVHHDDSRHSVVQLGAKLRSDYSAAVYAETFENNKREQAYAEVLRLLDTNHDGGLSDAEKHAARIILYGHSWGASAAIALARRLEKEGIPVLLTIQVDSIMKNHEDDSLIPANVAEAANFYQPQSFLHGQNAIRAADPARTRILGNFRFDYAGKPAACVNAYPWWERHVMKPHIEIECDPKVWNQVESLIRAKLPPVESALAR